MMGAWSVADQDMGPSTSRLVLDPRWHSLRALVIGTPELQKGGSDADGGRVARGRALSMVLNMLPGWPPQSLRLISSFSFLL